GHRTHNGAAAEAYDPATGTWSWAGDINIARSLHTVTLLDDGRVLMMGGGDDNFPTDYAPLGAELYDPRSNQWLVVPDTPVGMAGPSATPPPARGGRLA